MADWLSSMQQTFEYYIVDPVTWTDTERILNVKSSTISRDAEADTLGSASFEITELVGECYIRVYLITIQNGIEEKHPLGTYLVQTPSSTFDGRVRNVSMDAYTPLLELKENPTPLGYYTPKESNVLDQAVILIREHARAPIIETDDPTNLSFDFVANSDDTWLTYIRDLLANAKYSLGLDERGQILLEPVQETEALQPVWTYDDGNSSILYPEETTDHDIYGIPNVVEVTFRADNGGVYYSKVVNKDENSPTSTINRGREITYRDTSPNIGGPPSQEEVDAYAERLLKELSTIEYTITYTHGYCPVRVGDCVVINYERAGLFNIKAKVISQSIKCEPGCPVSEKAVFTTKLWR